jgi:hypothetical protein
MSPLCERSRRACFEHATGAHGAENEGGDADLAAAARDFWAGCVDARDFGTCALAASSFTLGDGVERNEDLGLALYVEACIHAASAGALGPCESAARGYDTKKEPEKARPFWRRNLEGLQRYCAAWKPGEVNWACHALASVYRWGKGTPRDLRKALELYERGCDAQDTASCAGRLDVKKELETAPKGKP